MYPFARSENKFFNLTLRISYNRHSDYKNIHVQKIFFPLKVLFEKNNADFSPYSAGSFANYDAFIGVSKVFFRKWIYFVDKRLL